MQAYTKEREGEKKGEGRERGGVGREREEGRVPSRETLKESNDPEARGPAGKFKEYQQYNQHDYRVRNRLYRGWKFTRAKARR